MTIPELLSHLHSLNVEVWAEDGQLFCDAPKGAMTPQLRAELVGRKAEILAFLSTVAGAIHIAEPPLQRVPRDGELPLSFAQQRMWFIDQFEPGGALYNIPKAFRIRGLLDTALVERSLNEIARRHEVLRTSFSVVNEQPVQIISPSLILSLPVIDLTDRPECEREGEALRLANEEARRPFDLARGPLLRATLLRLGHQDHVLLLTMHHIVLDGWSMGILLRELSVLYEAFVAEKPSPLPELPIQYADFAQWQRNWLQGDVLEAQLGYWKRQLAGAPTLLELPTDRPRPAVQTFRGASQFFKLPSALAGAIKSLSRDEKVTLFVTLLTAFQTLLHRYTGGEDIVIGSPIAGRNRYKIEKLIGFFVNTLVLRTSLSGNPTFRELLGRVREVALDAYAHQDLPFEKLVEELQPERHLSHNPLFQVMFVLQNTPRPTLSFPGLTLTELPVEHGEAMFDLSLSMFERAGTLAGVFEYNRDLFETATIIRMLGHFQTLLEGIVANPERQLSSLPLLTEAERHQLLVEWNDTQSDYPQDKCIHQLFEAQVERTPDAVAVACEGRELTYRELNCRANQLAHHLKGLGVGPEVLIGIYVERRVEMVVGILGILKAGGAYVPLDPAYPKERLAFMIKDTQTPILLTQQHLATKVPDFSGKVICLDADWSTIKQESEDNSVNGVTPDRLAYVIYTSGSTGQPKGVLIAHRGLVNYSIAIAQKYGLHARDRILQFSSLSFDVAAEELFPSWICGATVILRPDDMLSPGTEFLRWIEQERVTVLNLPTAFWQQWVQTQPLSKELFFNGLRLLIVGGEQVSPAALSTWLNHGGGCIRWLNVYGPTEATIGATLYEPAIGPDSQNVISQVPIGRPLANAQIYILDANLQPVPIGVPGELHVAGAGLARGYLHLPDLTAEKFIPNPFSPKPGARLYKSGDLARYLSDGNIEFLGRIDHEVKVRGFRVDLGEIETVLKRHPAVHEAVVLAREEMEGFPPQQLGLSLDDSLLQDDPEVLLKRIVPLGKDRSDHLLAELEAFSEDDVEEILATEMPIGRDGGKTMVRRFPQFDVSIHLKSDEFINPPRQSQRNWIVQRALDELTDDLQHLDKTSKRLVAGSERTQIQHEWRKSKARYDNSRLVIENQQVMQDWERPLMRAMAQIASEAHGNILEVGFGMGISATYLQEFGVKSHTIIECNDDIVKACRTWNERYPDRDIRLIEGKWQEVVNQLGIYDAILFDTYPLNEEEFMENVINSVTFAEHFFPIAANCLRRGGIFTYCTNEIDSFSRRHQRLVFKYFSSLTLSVVRSLRPPEDCNYWWADSMAVIKAIK